MLLPLRKHPTQAAPYAAHTLDLLIACHTRIRHFARLAQDVAAATAAPPDEIAEAARSLERYHRIALPLHEADEDLSIRPRLEAAPLPDEVRAALATIEDDHRRINVIVAELIADWAALAEAPRLLSQRAAHTAALTAALWTLWQPHLACEETLIFPAIALLPAETERSIATEMRDRRAAILEEITVPAPSPSKAVGP
jgi:hypothetical protein